FIVITLLVALTVIVLMSVSYRKMGWALVWYGECAPILLAWRTYYGAALTALMRAHIGLPGRTNSLRPRLRVPGACAGSAVATLFFAMLAWYGTQALIILEGDTMVSLPSVPTRLTQSVIPIGAVLFILAQLFSLPELLEQARGEGILDAEERELEEALKR